MAFSGNRNALSAYCQDDLNKILQDTSARLEPLPYIFGLTQPANQKLLGTPDMPMFLGGAAPRLGRAKKELLANGADYQPKYTDASAESDAIDVGLDEATATASGYDIDDVGTLRYRWSIKQIGVKVRKHDLDSANGKAAMGSVLEDSLGHRNSGFLRSMANNLWAGTLNQAGQSTSLWKGCLGLTHVMTADNYLGGVNRAVETSINPTVIAAGTQLESTEIDLDLGMKVNTGFVGADNVEVVGVATKSTYGSTDICVTTTSLWHHLHREAARLGSIQRDGQVDHYMSGAKFPWFNHDGIIYVFDRRCPSGEAYFLNTSTWLLAIHKKYNFRWQTFVDASETVEGGLQHLWSTLILKYMFACDRPDVNVRVTGLTTG